MAKIYFRDKAHKEFVMENLNKCRRNDCYHQAFFYVMGISEETRMNIGQMFDFKNDCIIPEGMHGGWQKFATLRLISGMDLQKKAGRGSAHQKNCSAVDMPRTLWRESNCGIRNIAEI